MVTAHEDHPMRSRLRELYFGASPSALRFQAVLVALDILIIGFFIFSQFVPDGPIFYVIDYLIAVFLAVDLLAKLYALGSWRRWMKYKTTWVDLAVLGTLLFPVMHNWGFLRILRLWTLVQRERFWNVLGGGRWNNTYFEDLAKAVVNLVVVVFLAAGLAQALFLNDHPKLNNFLDALYFVVAALTTTGFGDITIDSASGRIFSIVLMLTGITLVFSIAQKALMPQQKLVTCTKCRLDHHHLEAGYCRNCGTVLPPAKPTHGRMRSHHHHDN